MNLNEKLYEHRKNKGWSQEEFAEKLNVSRQTVSKWEIGKAVPELDKLIKISDIYQISIDELVKDNIEINFDNKKTIETSEKYKKIKKVIKILILTVLIIFLLKLIIDSSIIAIRKNIIEEMSNFYKENFFNIGITRSGYVRENIIKKENINDIKETEREYFYYVSEDGKKFVRIRDLEIDTNKPIKEIYIDLDKEKGLDHYDDVTEIYLEDDSYCVFDDYEFISPIRRITYALNSQYSIIGNSPFDSKLIAKSFENELSKVKNSDGDYLYYWGNDKMGSEELQDKLQLIIQKHWLGFKFDDYQDDIKEEREIINTQITLTEGVIEDVTVPPLEEYTKK